MMNKVLSLILCVCMIMSAVTCVPLVANAAAPVTGYTYKLSVKTTDDADGWNYAHFDLTNVDQSLPVKSWDIKNDIDDSDEEWSTTFYSDVFYNEASLYVNFGGITIPNWAGRVTVEINGIRVTDTIVSAAASGFETVTKTVAYKYEQPVPQSATVYTKDSSGNKNTDLSIIQSKTAAKSSNEGYIYTDFVDQYNAYWSNRYGTMTFTNESDSDSISLSGETDTGYCWKVASDTGIDHTDSFKLDAAVSQTTGEVLGISENYNVNFAFCHKAELTAASSEHGTTILSDKKAYTGDEVSIFTSQETGYELASLTVTAADGTDIPVTDGNFIMPNSNVSVNAVYAPITYKAKFIANGATVAEIPYTVETTSITEPDVPAVDGYNGYWQPYEFSLGGVTVNAVYEPIIHDFRVSASTPATCTSEGYDTYTCIYCGETYNKATTPARAHQFVSTGFSAPTCTEYGYTTYQCTNCTESYTGDYVAPKAHQYVADVVTPTCTEEGYTTYTCEVCGTERTKADGSIYKTNITKPVPHAYKVTATVPATCTTEGYDTYTCTNCGDSYNRTTTPALTHEWRYDKWTNDATDHWHICTRCDAVLDKESHDYGEVTYAWEGTDTVSASHTCKICGYVESETVTTASEMTKEPTCTENGETTYTAVFTIPAFEAQSQTFADIAPLGHDWQAEWKHDAKSHWHACSRCEAQKAKAAHSYGNKGNARFTCTVCGYVDSAKKKQAEKADKELAYEQFIAGLKGMASAQKVAVKWGKVKDADRYIIYATYCGLEYKFKKIGTAGKNATNFNFTKLEGKKLNLSKNVRVYIVPQKKVGNKYVNIFESPTLHIAGTKSKHTSVKQVKVAKNSFTLSRSGKAKIKPSLVFVNKNKLPILHVPQYRYLSSNTAVVKVDKNGTLTAIGKGTATVLVYSPNGYPTAIKVTVK